MKAQTLVNKLIPHKSPVKKGYGKAAINIALSKYWGKRNLELNLPTNSSLSISLPELGTETEIEVIKNNCADYGKNKQDLIYLNGEVVANKETFAKRISLFLNYFREDCFFKVTTHNSVATAAGLASSASGYAALVRALNDCFQWNLSEKKLSILARLGSGSASRSIFDGFVIWHKGQQKDGMDSYAEPIKTQWHELQIGLLEIDTNAKKMSSTQGMQNTVNTCELYQAWPKKAESDLLKIKQSIEEKDFQTLGETAENNALSMHATMIATKPPILYWQPESIEAMHKVWQLREEGIAVYFTMDAGPNLKLLFLKENQNKIKEVFSSMITITPF